MCIILLQILLGIKDADAELVSLTFRSLATLVDNFGVVAVLGGSKRARIFNSGVPRDVRLSSSTSDGTTSQHDSERSFDDGLRDNLSSVSGKSNSSMVSSSLNFLNYKMPAHMISERSSPDGDEIANSAIGGHLHIGSEGLAPATSAINDVSISSKGLLRSSSNNINLIEDDEEWPEWDNGNSSSSNGFETAVESLAGSESISGGDTGPATPTNNIDKSLTKTANNNNFENGSTGKTSLAKALSTNALTKKMQTFDIKEIDFKEVEHKEIDSLFSDMEPVFDFRQSKLEMSTSAVQQVVTAKKLVAKRTESPVAKANLNLFELQLDALAGADDLESGWNDEDTLEEEFCTEDEKEDGQIFESSSVDEKMKKRVHLATRYEDSSVEISEFSSEEQDRPDDLPCMLAQSSSEGL